MVENDNISIDEENYDEKIKIMLLGDSSVGKTSIIKRYCKNQYSNSFISTIGVDFETKYINIDFKTKYIKIGEYSVKVLIWDTAGQEKFRNIAKQYYKGANGVLLIYDVTNKKSFERIAYWMNELKDNNQIKELDICLVGNKIDLEGRVITREEGEKFALDNDIKYFEVSAKTSEGIEELFTSVTKGAVDKIFQANKEDNDDKKQIFEYLDNRSHRKKKKKCCM